MHAEKIKKVNLNDNCLPKEFGPTEWPVPAKKKKTDE